MPGFHLAILLQPFFIAAIAPWLMAIYLFRAGYQFRVAQRADGSLMFATPVFTHSDMMPQVVRRYPSSIRFISSLGRLSAAVDSLRCSVRGDWPMKKRTKTTHFGLFPKSRYNHKHSTD